MNEPPVAGTRGIVRPTDGFRHFDLTFHAPDPPLDRFIDRSWVVQWNLSAPFDQDVVTHPAVNLVFENGQATVVGVKRDKFTRHLEGSGRVLGVKFRPGGFRPFMNAQMSTLTDRTLPIENIFGHAGNRLAAEVGAEGDNESQIRLIHRFFSRLAPSGATVGETLSSAVELIASDPTLGRVDDLAQRLGTGVRHLQRLFAEHVGINPKWVIQRCRVRRVGEAALGNDPQWAELALELGYSDQTHLTREFKSTFGSPPARYAQACADDVSP